MKALAVTPGVPNSAQLIDADPPDPSSGTIRVRGLEVGICGTDVEIIEGGYGEPPCETPANPPRWQNGVSLLAGRIDPLKPGEQVPVHLCLKIDRPSTDEFHWTAQLWDGQGKRWAQVDDNGYPTRYWRAGDVITQDLMLAVPAELPAGDYVLRIGQYTWPDVKPVLTLDAAGQPQSDAAEIPVRAIK